MGTAEERSEKRRATLAAKRRPAEDKIVRFLRTRPWPAAEGLIEYWARWNPAHGVPYAPSTLRAWLKRLEEQGRIRRDEHGGWTATDAETGRE